MTLEPILRTRWVISWFLRPVSWIILATVLRLVVLGMIPFHPTLLLDRGVALASQQQPAHGLKEAWELLRRRSEFHPLTVDEVRYDEMGKNLAAGKGFVMDGGFIVSTPGQPAMYAGCTYPLFLGVMYFLFGSGNQVPVSLVQIGLQAVAIWFVFGAATRLAGRAAGAVAAAFLAFHPVLIWLSVSIMTEAVIVPISAALAWLAVQRRGTGQVSTRAWVRPTLLGVLLAALCLTRSTCFGFVLVIAALLLFQARKARPFFGKLLPCLGMLAVFAVVCAPWTIRNYIHWHRFIPFSTKSGVNAWFFNHPGLKVEFGRRAVEGPQPIDIFDPRIQSLPDEAARDARLMEMFREFVHENPGKFLGLCWMRFWLAALPVRITSDTLTALISAWYAKGVTLCIAVMAFVAAAAGRLRGLRLLLRCWPVLGFVIYWQAIQTLAGPGLRYRLPAEPFWAVLVGVLAVILAGLLGIGFEPRGLARRWLRRSR